MSEPRPSIVTLLSHALVAYTIEADNLYESRAPHQTTAGTGTGTGPWLISMVMWQNCLRHLADGPRTLAELFGAAGTSTNVDGMRRWGYMTIDTKGRRAPGRDSVVELTKSGQRAHRIWESVVREVEDRWRDRRPRFVELRELLEPISRTLAELPASMPILGYGFSCKDNVQPRTGPALPEEELTAELMARMLVRIAVDFEERAPVSLAMYADIMSALTLEGIPVRDLPGRTGVSKEAVAMAVGYLEKREFLSIEPTTPRLVRVTQSGLDAIHDCRLTLAQVEEAIRQEYGIEKLWTVLESVCENLEESLRPLAGGWRKTAPSRLPNFPMTLHRGGYPDGA